MDLLWLSSSGRRRGEALLLTVIDVRVGWIEIAGLDNDIYCNIAIPIPQYSLPVFYLHLCKLILMKIGSVTPEITRVTNAPFGVKRQKLE